MVLQVKNNSTQLGFKNSISDTSLFYTHKYGRMLLLLVYVDDILITGESFADVKQVIKDLNLQFDLKTLGYVNYFFGFDVTRMLRPYSYAKFYSQA